MKNFLGRGLSPLPRLHPQRKGDTPPRISPPRRLESRACGARLSSPQNFGQVYATDCYRRI